MHQPLISINIPVYKCEKHILRCLESVKNQTYQNIEIVLVNDCTADNSVEIIENFAVDNPHLNIRLIHHKENSGLSVVRNTGINESKGEFIYFLDSDDDITPNCIELLVNNYLQSKCQLIIAQNRWINTFDNTIKDFGFPTRAKEKIYTSNEQIFKAYCENLFPITSWNKLIKRDFLLEHQIYFIPGLYAQDELWFFHLMEKIESLSIIDDITYNYYLHGESVIFNRTKKNFENYLTILNYFEKSYQISSDKTRKYLIKNKVLWFKNMVMIMQWKAMKNDLLYFKQNYKRMKSILPIQFSDVFDKRFDQKTKKLMLLQNLPSGIGTNLFIKRYGN